MSARIIAPACARECQEAHGWSVASSMRLQSTWVVGWPRGQLRPRRAAGLSAYPGTAVSRPWTSGHPLQATNLQILTRSVPLPLLPQTPLLRGPALPSRKRAEKLARLPAARDETEDRIAQPPQAPAARAVKAARLLLEQGHLANLNKQFSPQSRRSPLRTLPS